MLKWLLLILTLPALILPFSARTPAELPHAPDELNSVITPENVHSLHYQPVPLPEPDLPESAWRVVRKQLNNTEMVAYLLDDVLYIEERISGQPVIKTGVMHFKPNSSVHSEFSTDGRYLVFYTWQAAGPEEATYDPNIYVWTLKTHHMLTFRHNHRNLWVWFYFVPNTNYLLTADEGGEEWIFGRGNVRVPGGVKIRDLVTGNEISSYDFDSTDDYHSGYGYGWEIALFNPADASMLIRAKGNILQILDLYSGALRYQFPLESNEIIRDMMLRSNNVQLLVRTYRTLYLADLKQHTLQVLFRAEDGEGIDKIVLSPDESQAAVMTWRSLYPVNLDRGENQHSVYRSTAAQHDEMEASAFSPDGRLLYLITSTRLMVFDTRSGTMLKVVGFEHNFTNFYANSYGTLVLDAEGRYFTTMHYASVDSYQMYRWSVDTP